MSANLEQLRLKLDADNSGTVDNTYDIYPIDEVTLSSSKDAFSIAPPGLAASENILLGLSGMQADITIQANIWNDGSDRANGTYTSTVVTTEEQNEYLEDVMQDPGFSAAWQLDHLTGAAFNDDEVFVESVEPTLISQENPKWKPIRIRLRRGGSV